MDLPSYIRDFLQTNYYIPAEQLDLPFDRMPASLRELIMSKCLNPSENGGFEAKSAEEVLDKVREQFADDINSDVTKSPERQLDNFVAHHKTFAALIAAAEKNEKNPSDFDRVAILTAAKRMAADEYADTPKTLSNFLKIKEETAAELRVKYYTARYFDAHGKNGNEADGAYHEHALSDIAEISRMVREGKTDEIANRFNLPDTQVDRDAAKGATLSFAMAELKSFSDRVEKRVKDSPFVKRVNGLNDSFKQKYPKSYMAAKLVGNTAAALSDAQGLRQIQTGTSRQGRPVLEFHFIRGRAQKIAGGQPKHHPRHSGDARRRHCVKRGQKLRQFENQPERH